MGRDGVHDRFAIFFAEIQQLTKGDSEMKLYKYGMRLRGFSIGCQPKDGFWERQDDATGRYHDILLYTRELTDAEVADYELDKLD